ncbi:MAG: helix-turn-helix domain-containing protein [Ekhidna sp.]|nr:helix-turn-helix domain-containing protein [Ekhidna sp.]MBC6409502.1 helix-turn-helix domain-containing protein [Ekhidna sp.]
MEDYNKIINSLQIRFIKARNINILKPVTIENNYEVENHLILVKSGEIRFGKEKEQAKQGDVIFIPSGGPTSISYGSGKPTVLSKDDFLSNKNRFLKSFDKAPSTEEHYSYVAFDVRAFDSVNFFSSLDIPPFKIEENYKLAGLIENVNDEALGKVPGRDRIVKVLTENMTIELIRYIINNNLFVEKIVTNSTYFKDPRLLELFTFIKENLSENLSNRTLAGVANVSEDYIGQYFKMLMGINPQDYVEYQRMEAAVNLLRTSRKSIRDIGKEVGYKDTAYFCRRFKTMFGIPAGKMRKRESLMNI